MPSKKPGDYAELLKTGRWFSGLPAELQAGLLDRGVLRSLSAGERLFSRGDPPCGLYGVLGGALRISGVSENGKEALLILAEPPSWFGEIAVFDGLPRTHDAIAENESLLLQVPQASMLELFDQQPRWWQHLGLLMGLKLRLAFIAMEDMSLLPLAVRLARRLLMMVEGYGERADKKRVVEIRQDQLAMMLSTSRQTVNTLLKELEARATIRLSYGEIEILDIDALRSAAALSDSDELQRTQPRSSTKIA